MTLRHLKIFIAVCEYGSTSRAAEALYIVQPTVSHSIIELENFYKITLFERVKQRLVLTEVGRELLVKAKEIVSGFEDFESLATLCGRSPKVRVGATLTLGQTLIPSFLQKVLDDPIGVEPSVFIRPSSVIEKGLEEGDLDFAVIGGDVLSNYLHATPLSYDRYIFVAHKNYDVPESLTFEELLKYPLLLREQGSSPRDYLEKFAASKGLDITPRMDSTNNQTLVTAIYSCLGIAFLPDSYVVGHIERETFKEVKIMDFSANRTNYLVVNKNKRLNSFQSQAINIMKGIAN